MTTSVLFVCLGNICRSPTAEAVFRARAAAAGLDVVADSAGTSDWHIGNPPYGPAIAAGAARGYDLRPLRARQVTSADFDRFDHIIAMDTQNRADIEALRPTGSETPVTLCLSHADGVGLTDVPDPYYTRDFEEALDLIEAATDGLIAQLRQNVSAVSPKDR
ncbi:MAG: low molecular weight protein-tyrosine-phosphatase [Pseudomonadota bacterium]